ncbi:MetQ/NlpA family ABC transporter substrate-binding protein [Schumannella luteola]|uniref:D-methionine transport system substrate-binding protein n=1 Tax=Schumannella luteola TaxID=472059 RepID=A0A852YQ28_9MICO|nr:MetQ/NlpA family ABC transporter substrate-binding protein [Schumannella luteola]NYG99315.1 D-methionine transport system substrate-binding protein [Schumannella luteola]TPX06048.1 metal ABC transporter substrate-binding protein [Schumannella luteola]
MSAPTLPDRPKRKTGLVVGVIVAIVAVIAIVAGIVVATNANSGSKDAAAGSGEYAGKTVNIGVADASQAYWKTYIALAKKELGVDVKLTNFSDYSQPNPALSQKQVDLNQFQHIQYLANYNVTNDDDLQPIGATAVYPLPLYSTKFSDVKDVTKGAKVAIPNDAINQARGLLVLQDAGLLKLKNGGSAFSSTKDIESADVEVTPLDASQTAGALQSGSVDAAIVNKNYATDAGLKTENAIYQDDPSSEAAAPYVNIFAARKGDVKNDLYLKLAALYHDKTVEKGVQEANGGTAVFRETSAADLQKSLAKVEQDARDASSK